MPKRGGGGPRQPLSQRRPGKAASVRPGPGKGKEPRGKSGGGAGSVGTRKGTVGGPPPTSKLPPRAAARITRTSPDQAEKRLTVRKPLTGAARHAQAIRVWDALVALYPDAHCELEHHSPWQLLVATILSAQCTDKRVNLVTPVLFKTWPTPEALAAAPQDALEAVIRSTGFFRAKAKAILGVASALVSRHAGEVPSTMEDLVVLPGVGRKTANVVLGNAFGVNHGVVVDTHVGRLANRLGLTSESDPVKVERDLMGLFAPERWTLLSHLLIWHGRRVCDARKPRCGDCTLRTFCPSSLAPVVKAAPAR